MNDLEKAIEERQEKVRRFEKEVDQANELLQEAQRELSVLLAARQIVSKEQLVGKSRDLSSQLPINGIIRELVAQGATNSPGMGTAFDKMTFRLTERGIEMVSPHREMTLVDEVKATLANSPSPLGPSAIRAQLAQEGRTVPQNVMTGVLSRLAKEGRILRLGRGQYQAIMTVPTTEEEDRIEQNETA